MAVTYPGSGTFPGATTFPGDSAATPAVVLPFSAVAQPDNVPPRVFLSVTNMSGSTVTVMRRDPDGVLRPVANASPATLTAGAWLGYDYLAPLNQAVSYVATPSSGLATSSPAVTLASSASWLQSPGNPNASVVISEYVLGDDTETYSADIGIHDILDSEFPVIIAPAVWKSPTGQGVLGVPDAASMRAMDALLRIPVPLQLQTVGVGLTETTWVMITARTKTRAGAAFESSYRQYALQWRVCDAPFLISLSQRTGADLAAEAAGLTAAYWPATYATAQGIYTGVAGT